MPRCNGFQVCRTLRKEPGLRNTKIIVSSGRDFDNDREAAFQAGADIYLTKPFEPTQLISILSRLFTDGGHGNGNGHQPKNGNSREGMTLKFWGVRGSIPTPGASTVEYGGNTSCIELRCEGQIVILDAGTGLRSLGQSLMKEFDQQPPDLTLLLSHTHWDHIQGLPFFLPFYRPNNHLRILGYEGSRNGLETVLSSQMESPFFPVGLKQVPANLVIEELKELNFPIGRLQVRAFFANHPGICVGYRIFGAGVSVAFFPDNEPYLGQIKAGHLTSAKDPAALEYARTQDQKMIEFLRGTDVLIMDAQYDCDEYKEHVGWGHGCVDEVRGCSPFARRSNSSFYSTTIPTTMTRRSQAMTCQGPAARGWKEARRSRWPPLRKA
jgi:phosphoribosyl 1,2-cyclic phosphodiesterase